MNQFEKVASGCHQDIRLRPLVGDEQRAEHRAVVVADEAEGDITTFS
jgi:hypothetical protein